MARNTFEIRFDKHGHIVVEDDELVRRIAWLLKHDGGLVLRMRSDEPVPDGPLPNFAACYVPAPEPVPKPHPRNGILCPNSMCGDCGRLKIVRAAAFDDQFHGRPADAPPTDGSGRGSAERPRPDDR